MTHERFEDFLGELPRFAPDPRQASFLSRVGPSGAPKKALLDTRLGKVEIANVGRGWPASSPNLGFLQDSLEKLIEIKKLDPNSKKEVTVLVSWAVQRVIRLTISAEPGNSVTVSFWTKDDYGVYSHGFKASHPVE